MGVVAMAVNIPKGEIIVLAPTHAPNKARGLFKGADPSGYRDRGERLNRSHFCRCGNLRQCNTARR
jgi:hypothetical protein